MIAQGEVLAQGSAIGELLILDEPISFWGGYDPKTGIIIDKEHPQIGVYLTGKIIMMPGSKGSSGTPGALGESLRLKTGPVGIIICKPDINIVVAAQVVAKLYSQHCPVTLLDEGYFKKFICKKVASIDLNGRIRQELST